MWTKNFGELFTVCWSRRIVQKLLYYTKVYTHRFFIIFTFQLIFIYETKPKFWIWSSYLDERRKQMWILAFRYVLAIWLALCWLFFMVLITSSSTWHILDLGHQHFSILAQSNKELFHCVGAGAMWNYPECSWLSNSNETIIEGCTNPLTAENTPEISM